MKILSERKAFFAVLAAIFVYIAVVGSVSVARHYDFQTQAWDMGIFFQTFWNTAQGRIMQNSIEEVSNHLGVHMSPIIFVLLPGFLVFPSAYYLLIIQTLALALGALPLYLFAKKVLERRGSALIIAFGYLLYPALHWVNFFDFHPIAFLIPALLAAFYFFNEKKWLWFWVFMVLASVTQEDAILAVAFSGLFLAVLHWRQRDERKNGLWVAAAALGYFIISVKLIMPVFGGGLLRLDRYAALGGSFSEIARNLFTHPPLFFKTAFTAPKLTYLFWIFFPVLFLPFIRPLSLLLLVPGLLENLLTNFSSQFSGFYQYDSMLIAGIFISSVYGLKSLLKIWPEKIIWVKWLFAAVILAGFLFRSPVSPFYFPTEIFKSNERRQTLRQIVKNIPGEISVSAHANILPHLAKRERVYMLGSEPFWVDGKPFRPDAVIIDGGDLFGFYNPEALQSYADSYALSGEYNIQVIRERYIIFGRK
ncbi:MAG: DUF2079 domain-containing protein [Candidatus Niyogibacteria bacterium]|nr:MAG: DUF2079 domain-containing protein [Candidatus Niyogibacteria bacterium]